MPFLTTLRYEDPETKHKMYQWQIKTVVMLGHLDLHSIISFCFLDLTLIKPVKKCENDFFIQNTFLYTTDFFCSNCMREQKKLRIKFFFIPFSNYLPNLFGPISLSRDLIFLIYLYFVPCLIRRDVSMAAQTNELVL